MVDGVTKEDLRDMRDDLKSDIRDGFDAITERLDILNGRVGKGEVTLGEHGVKIGALEREIFQPNGKPKVGDAERRQVIRPDSKAVTKRDVLIVSGTLTTIGGVLWWLHDMGLFHFAVSAGKP